MASDRIQRRIESLLDEADEAILNGFRYMFRGTPAAGPWGGVRMTLPPLLLQPEILWEGGKAMTAVFSEEGKGKSDALPS